MRTMSGRNTHLYKEGEAVFIPSEIKRGMSTDELYFETDVRSISNKLVNGFAPKEYVRLRERRSTGFPAKGDVKAQIIGFLDGKRIVKLLFPGELLATSNPVYIELQQIKRSWKNSA